MKRKKLLRKILSTALCAALLTGAAATASISTYAISGPMQGYENEWGDRNYAYVELICLEEEGYFKWEFDEEQGMGYVVQHEIYKDGDVFNEPIEEDAAHLYGYEGVSYDKDTNTLTLSNVKEPLKRLCISAMGDDFKLIIQGECELAGINIYDDYKNHGYSGLTIGGTGHLVLNNNNFEYKRPAILFSGEESPEKLTLGKDVSIEMYGGRNESYYEEDEGEQPESVVIAWYGSSIPDSSVLAVQNGQKIDVDTGFIYDYPSPEQEAVYLSKSGVAYDLYPAENEEDPDGIYAVSTNYKNEDLSPDEKIYFKVRKYYYVERFDCLMEDKSFKSEEMNEEEFEASPYKINTFESQKKVAFYDERDINENWYYTGYQLTNKEDPDGIYSISRYIYGKTEEERRERYSMYLLGYDEENNKYTRPSDDSAYYLNEDEFAQNGFVPVTDDNGDLINVHIPVADDSSSYYSYYLVKDPAQPDLIYGINSDYYFSYQPDVNYSLNKITYNENYGKYILDPDFSTSIRAGDFADSPYEYVMDEIPESMPYYSQLNGYSIWVDDNGKRYTTLYLSGEGMTAFSFSDDDTFIAGDKTYYALTPTDVNPDDLTRYKVKSDTQFNHFVYGDYLNYTSKDRPLTNLSVLENETSVVGKAVELKAEAIGGTEPYKYAFMYKLSTTSSWKTAGTKFGDSSTASFTPKTAGTYDILISVKDATEKTAAKRFTLTVNDKLVSNSTVSATEVNVGTKVTLTGGAQGGKAPYFYTYQYQKPGSNSWVTLGEKYGLAASQTFTAKINGVYNARVLVKDSEGTVKSSVFEINATGSLLSNNSTISADAVSAGQKITMSAKAEGGVAPYLYTYEIKKPGASSWTTVGKRNFTAATASFTPADSGEYEARVLVKDANGTVASKAFKVTVAGKALTNNSTVSVSGSNCNITAVANGGTAPYTYTMQYKKKTDSKWTLLGTKYGSVNLGVFELKANADEYEVLVSVKDADGTIVAKRIAVK